MSVRSLIVALAVASISASGSVLGAEGSACKGMTEGACAQAADSCRWVGSYQRKDGREVKGYCRMLPQRGVADGAATDKK